MKKAKEGGKGRERDLSDTMYKNIQRKIAFT